VVGVWIFSGTTQKAKYEAKLEFVDRCCSNKKAPCGIIIIIIIIFFSFN